MVMYGLKHIKSSKLIGFSLTSNDGGDFCVSVAVDLSHNISDNVWLVSSRILAETARLESMPWYNADFETPHHPYKSDELEVVEIQLSW